MKEIKRSTKIQLLKSGACILVALVLIINTVFLYASQSDDGESADPSPSTTEIVDSTPEPTAEPEQIAEPEPTADPVIPAQDPEVTKPQEPTQIQEPEQTLEPTQEPLADATETPALTDGETPSVEPGVSPSATPTPTPIEESKEETVSKLSAEGGLPTGIASVAVAFSDGIPAAYSLHVGSSSMSNFSDAIAYMKEYDYVLKASKTFDIHIEDKDNKTVTLEGIEATVTVDFGAPIYTGKVSERTMYAVLHRIPEESVILDSVPFSEAASLSSITFTTTSFSPFAVVVMDMLNEDSINPLGGEETDDLSRLLTNVSITTADGKPIPEVDGKLQVNTGEDYKVSLSFAEDPEGLQFDASGPMTYHLPAGITPKQEDGSFKLTYTDSENHVWYIPVNYSFATDGTVTITVCPNREHDDEQQMLYEKFMSAANARMNVRMEVQFQATNDEIKFGTAGTKDIVVNDEHSVEVTKDAVWYDSNNKTMYYRVTVTSTGVNTNVEVKDAFNTGKVLKYNRDLSMKISSKGNNWKDLENVTPTESDTGFSLTIPAMKDGETVYLEYSAAVTVNGNAELSADDTTNTVIVKSKEENEEKKKECTVNNWIQFGSEVTKSGKVSEEAGNKKTITWTIKVNESGNYNVSGWLITDSIDEESQDIMKYSGDGITIKKSDGTTQDINWVDLDSYSSSEGWSYKLPDDAEDYASYEITYTTEVDVAKEVSDVTVKNGVEVEDKDGGSGNTSGSVTVTPSDQNKAGVLKEALHLDKEKNTVTWKITATIPAAGLDTCTITDIIPYLDVYDNNVHYSYSDIVDEAELTQNLIVTGIEDQESYDIDFEYKNGAVSAFTVTFYKDKDKNKTGLLPSDEAREITLTFDTQNSMEWIQASESLADWTKSEIHTNNVVLHANDHDFDGSASVRLSGEDTKTIDKKYVEYDASWKVATGLPSHDWNTAWNPPVWKYQLTLTGVNSDQIEIQEEFDKDLLRWAHTHDAMWELGGDNFPQLYWSNNSYDYFLCEDAEIITEDDGKITVKGIPMDLTGNYYKYYQIRYKLSVKNLEALTELQKQAMLKGGTTYLNNTAIWGEISDSDKAPYKYSNNAITKALTTAASAENGYTATYTIEFNKDKYDYIADSNGPLTIKDTMSSNLRFKPETLMVYDADTGAKLLEGTDYTYEVKGTVLTLNVPDDKYIRITYDARVLGAENSNQTYANTVTAMGSTATANGTMTITSGGVGSASTEGIKIYKYAYGNTHWPLAGAEFELQRLKDGKWEKVGNRTFTTGEDGCVTIYGDQFIDGWTLLDGVQYRLVEITAPAGYAIDKEEIPFTFKEFPESRNEYSHGDKINVSNSKENFHIVKKDSVGGNTLAGATFELRSSDNKLIDRVTTGTNGIASFNKLNPGTYYLQETAAPEGYKLDSKTYTIVINEEDLSVSSEGLTFSKDNEGEGSWGADITNEKKTGRLKIAKQVAGITLTEDEIYKFSIKSTDITPAENREVEVTVSANGNKGEYLVENLPLGTYEVQEIGNNLEKDGYKWTVSVTGSVNQSGNAPATVSIVTDSETKEVTYTNTYKKFTDAGIVLEGTKVLSGGTLTNSQFKFILSRNDDKEGVALPENPTANLTVDENGNGTFTFDEIKFSKAGTYTFIVREYGAAEEEKEDRIAGIAYDGTNYTITVEVSPDKENSTYKIASVTGATKNTNGIYTIDKDADKAATFVNRVEEGKLEITKKVIVKDAQGNTVDEANWPDKLKNKTYTFKLTDSKGKVYPDITLTATQPEIIENLPTNVTYNIVEDNASVNDYIWQVTSNGVDVTSGIKDISISDGNTSSVEFTNTYTKINGVNITLGGTKGLLDGTLTGGEFEFVLSGDTLQESLSKTNDAKGVFTFDPIVFEKADTYHFTIKENTPNQDDSKYQYDRSSYTIKVVVSQINNTYAITSVKSGEADLNEVNGIYMLPEKTENNKTASFINREKKGSLTISKKVEAPENSGFDDAKYQFTVQGSNGKYYDANGNAYDTAQTIDVTPGTDVTITGLPVNVDSYTVEEIAPNYNKAVYNWKVTGDGSVQVGVSDGGTATAAFTNTFTEIGSASMNLKGSKALEGARTDSDYTFKFEIIPGENSINAVFPNAESVHNNGDFIFENITFTQAGDYTFTVKENTANKATGIDYDEETKYVVNVHVDLNGDETAYEVKTVSINGTETTGDNGTYTLPNKDGETASFVNSVKKGSLEITKEVNVIPESEADGFTSGPYTFTVQDDKNNYYNQQGAVVAKEEAYVTIAAGGREVFNNLPIGIYTVSETNDNVHVKDYNWTVAVNETSGQTVKVKVEDKEEPTAVAFVNTYTKLDGVSIVLKGTKSLTGSDSIGNDYWFHIEQDDTDLIKVATVANKQNVGENITFDAIQFTKAETYHFTVSELPGENDGIEYSDKDYLVTVVVEPNETNTAYEVTVTGADRVGDTDVYKLKGDSDEPTFVNRVRKGSLTITKTAGAVPFDKEEYTFKVWKVVNETTGEKASEPSAVVTLKPGESETINDLEIGTYIVSEEDANHAGYIWTVEVNGTKEKDESGRVVIEDKGSASVEFTNTYTEKSDATIVLGGTKTLIGIDGNGSVPAPGTYKFKIEQIAGKEVKLPENVVSNRTDGSFDFGAIHFTEKDEYIFKVSEVIPKDAEGKPIDDGIDYDPTSYQVKVKVVEAGTEYKIESVEGAAEINGIHMVNKPEGKEAAFVNRVKKGNLKITKNVEGITTNKTYKFIVKDEAGNIYDQFGNVDADAMICVTLDNVRTNTVTVKDLPEGKYTITEVTSDVEIIDYIWSVYVGTGDDKKSGSETTVVVKESSDAQAVFTNKYDEMAGTSITLKGSKELIGGVLAGEDFEFSITATGNNSGNVTLPSTTVSNNKDGVIGFGQIGFSKVGLYTLEISEKSKSTPEVACDNNTSYTVEVDVDESEGAHVIKSVKVNGNIVEKDKDGYYNLPKQKKTKGGVDYEASFINELKQNSLFIKKNKVVNKTGNTDFDTATYSFTVAKVKTIDGTDIEPIYYNQSGIVVTDAEAKKIAVKSGETVEVKNLPEGFYIVKEEKSGYDDNNSTYKWDVAVVKNANGNKEAEASIKVSLDASVATAEFTNTFTDISPVSMGLKGTKTLDGGDISEYDGQFKFILTQGEVREGASWNNVSMPTTPVTNSTDDGKGFTFQNITFNKAGTYTFIVREYGAAEEEEADRIPGIDYDGKEYEVVVTVGKNDTGTAYVVMSVFVDGTDVTPSGADRIFDLPKQDGKASFVNRVMKGSLKITKAEVEKPFDKDTFTFTVQGSDYNKTVTIESGKDEIINDLPIGKYTISEDGDRTGYVWNVIVNDENDAKIQQTGKGIVEVEVTDNGTADVTFNNTYTKITGTYMTLEGTKYLDGGTQTAGDYEFEIVQVPASEGETISNPITASASTYDADGNFKLQIAFDKEGTYRFEVKEVNTGKNGIAYDKDTKYNLTVTVGPDGDKYKITSVTGDVEGSGNSYKIKTPTGKKGDFVNRVIKGSLEITKTVAVGVTTITPDKSYYFTVQSGNTYYSQDGTPSNVPVKIEVKAGATLPVTNLPVGEYTVKEVTENASDMKISGYKWLYVSAGDVNGNNKEVTVSENNPVSVSFVNHYEKIGGVSVKLTGSKELIGGSLGTYDFAIQAIGDNAKDVVPGKTSATNGLDGKIDFGNITFNKKGTYTFEVKETSSSNAQIKCDGTTYTVEVKVDEVGDAYVVTSVEEVKIDADGKEIRKGLTKVSDTPLTYELLKQKKTKGKVEYEASFINEVRQNNLIIEKIVDDQTKNGGFASDTYYFTVARAEGAGDYTYYDQNGKEGTKDTRISVQAGKPVEVKNLPEGVYIVSEVDPTYNTTKYSWEVDGNGRVKVEYGKNPATVTVTNTFTEKTPASMNVKGTKILKGGKIEDYSGKFKFILTPVGENWGSDASVETWNENGEFTFSKMTFMGEGTYTFTVEEADTGDGIDYDTEKYTVTVNVKPDADGNYKVNGVTASDKDGKNYMLTSDGETWILPTHERNGETATFVNEKKPEEPVPTATPTETPTATPTSTETPTPGATSTPSATPSATETPGPSATPGTTPGATATPVATPDQTPAPEETPTPDNTPNPVVTPGNNPAPTPRGSVLGARKVKVGGTRAAVLGARRGADFAVLGKRRKPSTGDSMALLIWIITMSVAMGGAITSSTMLSLENGRKRRRR